MAQSDGAEGATDRTQPRHSSGSELGRKREPELWRVRAKLITRVVARCGEDWAWSWAEVEARVETFMSARRLGRGHMPMTRMEMPTATSPHWVRASRLR